MIVTIQHVRLQGIAGITYSYMHLIELKKITNKNYFVANSRYNSGLDTRRSSKTKYLSTTRTDLNAPAIQSGIRIIMLKWSMHIVIPKYGFIWENVATIYYCQPTQIGVKGQWSICARRQIIVNASNTLIKWFFFININQKSQ